MTLHAYAPEPFLSEFAAAFAAEFPDRRLVAWSRPEEFVAGVGEAEYLVVLRPPRGHWGEALRLRLLQCVGAGIGDVFPAPDLPPGVAVANMAGMSAAAMGEFGLMLILAMVKGLPIALDRQRRHAWERYRPGTVAGRTVGILGMGNAGRALGERCAALGMRVIATDAEQHDAGFAAAVYPPEETMRVVTDTDVLAVLLPLTDRTRGLLDREALLSMKPGSHLICLSRGGIVDEDALAELLASGHLAGAALDVFSAEPLPAASPLWDAPNLVVTPHVSGGFPGFAAEAARRFVENADRVAAGLPVRSPVDPDRGW